MTARHRKSKARILLPGLAVLAAGAVVAGAALLISTPAYPEAPNCGPRDSVVKALTDKFREAPAATGISDNGSLVEVLASEEGATWSILLTQPDGTSCLVAAGESWQPLAPFTATAVSDRL